MEIVAIASWIGPRIGLNVVMNQPGIEALSSGL
jgi:hypothetical protein